MSDIQTNSLLTEHFGYAPISIVDDVINSVNEVMYKCTQAVEDYLHERQHLMVQELEQKKTKNEDDDVMMEKTDDAGRLEIPANEIELGTAKLETLLESSVDKNFDLFELYAFRNILTIPSVLLEEGWFKLEHHKDLNKDIVSTSDDLDGELQTLQKEINDQLMLKKLLLLQKMKITKINKFLQIYWKSIQFLQSTPDYDKIKPMKENLHFVVSQLKTLFEDLLRIKSILIDQTSSVSDHNDTAVVQNAQAKLHSSERDQYIDSKANKLLQSLGLVPTRTK